MNEKEYTFRRPKHGYGSRFNLRLGKRVADLLAEVSEDVNPPKFR